MFLRINRNRQSPALEVQTPYQRHAESSSSAGLCRASRGYTMTDYVDAQDTVLADWGCECGERRVDWLIWINDETVQCQTCGAEYQPGDKGEAS